MLENKADFGLRLKKAYDTRDKAVLSELMNECDVIIEKIKALRVAHRTSWFKYNKSFGFEVEDIRYGGMTMRFDTVKELIRALLSGEIDHIDELDAERLRYDCKPDGSPIDTSFIWAPYQTVATTGIL